MIKITIQRQNKTDIDSNTKSRCRIISFEIEGHADFAEYGEDIICAAVSSVGQMTVNGLIEILELKDKLKFIEKDGYIFCDLKNSVLTEEEFEKADILVESMYSYLKEVAEVYKDFVELKVEKLNS